MNTLSVIIPAYEHLAEILKCINTLALTMTGDCELIVQDDCSPSVNLCDSLLPTGAQVARNAVNVGFAANANAGARRANGDLLFFVNQDTYATLERSKGWDAALIKAFDNPEIGIVGARLLFPDNRIQSAGGLFDGRFAPFHRCLGYSDPDYHEVSTPCEVSWVTGAALAIRRTLFEGVGGFDEAYQRGYFEDVDLCMKARERGFKVWYEPTCTLYHRVGTTGGNPENFSRNAQLFKRRWVDSGKIAADTNVVAVRYW